MKTVFLRIHLTNGETLDGADAPTSDEDIEKMKGFLGDLLSKSGGWQINIPLLSGDWAAVPKDSVLWVELVSKDLSVKT